MVNRRAVPIGRVLVTRPAGEAADTLCATVEAAGYEVYHQPLMELHGLPQLPPAQRRMVLDLDRYEHVIFISANAVHFGMALLEDFWPQLPAGLTWYAIGDATAASLAHFGIEAVTPGSVMSSEGLLADARLQDMGHQRVLIVKGEGGRDALRQELSRRGALVDELACYRRSSPSLATGALAARLVQWNIDVILLSSGEGFANMLLLLSPEETTKLKHTAVIVPSERVASMAYKAGFDRVVTAENASDMAMVRALEACMQALENDR
ncbi:MAG TPA: uroporphyrinogen-III synthase [Halioglobus sp.]